MTARIIAAARTPVAPRGGALSDLPLHALAAPVVAALLDQTGLDPTQVDEVIVSNALGAGGNPARHVVLAAGLPETIAGLSIDRQCAGGMDAILVARAMILSGAADVVIAGGVESYSRRPERRATFADGSPPEPYDQAPFTPWPDRDPLMHDAAAHLAQTQQITCAEQDSWAIQSHAKALASGACAGEIIALNGLTRDGFTRILTPAHCARAKTLAGSITAANAAVAADAAAFCVVVSDSVAGQLKVSGTKIIAGATLGHIPEQPGLSPLPAIARSLSQARLAARELDVIEVMEAYAVQAIACVQHAGLDPDRVNIGGGALARGHPIGASGAINVVRLHHALMARDGGTGLATIAAAGGVGSAVILGA